jgi:hypothetical protein
MYEDLYGYANDCVMVAQSRPTALETALGVPEDQHATHVSSMVCEMGLSTPLGMIARSMPLSLASGTIV